MKIAFARLFLPFFMLTGFLMSLALFTAPPVSAAGNEKSNDVVADYCLKHNKMPKKAKPGCTSASNIKKIKETAAWRCQDFPTNTKAGADCVERQSKILVDKIASEKPGSPADFTSKVNGVTKKDAEQSGGSNERPPDTYVGGVPASKAQIEKCKQQFFGLKPWYQYLDHSFSTSISDMQDDPCTIKCFNIFNEKRANPCGGKSSDVPAVLLVIIDDLLRVAGMVAVAFVLVGAFQYAYSQGEPDKTASAQSSIVNALIGLAVALVAIAFVSFIGNRLGG